MEIDLIREKISEKIDDDNLWASILQDTEPGNYGTEDINVVLDPKDIWVDVQGRKFTFKKTDLSFCARLVSSNDEDGYFQDFEFVVSGSGEFEFVKGSQDIKLSGLEINEHLDLYPGEE
jgi:hypothetical protein